MSGPAIGVCAAVERVRWASWDVTVTLAPRTYVGAVQAAGAMALLLPPDEAALTEADPFLDRVDALILAGGSDLDPASYGARPDPHTKRARPERDRFEIALARRALERGMPLLGICRGMQLLNVARGGTLVQHLPDLVGGDEHCRDPGDFGEHDVRLASDSLAERATGSERITVKSHHHQGVAELGSELVPTGWSVSDDLIEAIELPEHPFALGVLWHPEEDQRSKVIGAFVSAARAKVGVR